MRILLLKRKYLFFLLDFLLLIPLSLYFSTIILWANSAHSVTEETQITSTVKVSNQEMIDNIYQSQEKIAYLTFDDGPTKKGTPKILDILKENNIKATFFVIGKRVEENPELVKRAYEEGHFIANHTYSHQDSSIYQNKESFLKEIEKTNVAIAKALGMKDYNPHLFRFPCGSQVNYSMKKNYIPYLKELDYAYLDWNCLNDDGVKKYSASQLLNNLKNTVKNKNALVILMHDSGDLNQTDEVLQSSIDYLKQQGYEFKNMRELF